MHVVFAQLFNYRWD